MVAKGIVKAPIVIGRDHLDAGSVASPNRETEAMRDGTDAVSDWPILNALINTAGGATWVSFHHGGGVGIGFSQHAGMVIVADGTPEAARTAGTGADLRPGHGRGAPRGCRLPGSDRGCPQDGHQDPDAGQGTGMKPSRLTGFLLAILLGLVLSLAYGWLFNPFGVRDTSLSSLREDYKADYVLMVAEGYAVDGNLDRVISLLNYIEPGKQLQSVQHALITAQRMGYSLNEMQDMADLEKALAGGAGQ